MKCGVIGYGRFGKLWTDILIKHGYEVIVYDQKEIDGKTNTLITHKLAEVTAVDFLFLLVPISQVESICKKISLLLKPHTVIVDACSVKVYPVAIMKKILSKYQPIIATHPLFGPDSVAKMGMIGQKIIIHKVKATKKQMEHFKEMLHRFKLHIFSITPESHDKNMAYTQALVHFIGRGLSALKLKPQTISTPDYQSLLNMNSMVENDTKQLFLDMQRYNPYAKKARA
ncbi:MAG: prephenate dehydrogenase/arogenate dehydrogenase family protein, partial [bacterium]|nr:prephenate dehydrogenase/arogenate dehydrogenase family protein [bacterium]